MTAGKIDFSDVPRELGMTALVALGITFPLVALRTVDDPMGLQIEGRWLETAIAILLIVIGRLGLILLRQDATLPVLIGGVAAVVLGLVLPLPDIALQVIMVAGGGVLALRALGAMRRTPQAVRDARAERMGEALRKAVPLLATLAVLFAFAMPFMPFSSRYVVDVGTLILTYVMLGWGLNIIVGYAGLLDLGYVAFYAVGAYSYGLLATHFDLSFWVCLPLAGMLAASFGLLLGFPVLRLRGDYFAIVTLGFGEIVRIIIINWYSLTNGPDGVPAIPRPNFFGMAVFSRKAEGGMPPFNELFGLEYSTDHRIIFLYYLILVLALLVAAFTLRIRNLPIGRAWEALREDDIACASLGINRTTIKLAAFGISAMWGGFAGSFFATRQGFISPESFTFIESAIILAVVVMGGMGNLVGIALAACLLIGLPEVFRDLSQYRMVAFGGGLVLIMVWRPQGLLSHREPTVRLFGKKGRREVPT